MNPVPIAVVGASCRFPSGANDLDKLWKLVWEGHDSWSDTPAERYNWKAFYHPDHAVQGTYNHRGGHYIEDNIKAFDAKFFGITTSEAQAVDPQQRLLLMTAYEALENAGIPIESVRGSNTGVFVGIFANDYEHALIKDPLTVPKYLLTGCGPSIMANRLSYLFDLKGPSLSIDTACSGSMVAVHQACQSLWTGESETALVGGANLLLLPDMMLPMSLLQ
jgi:acyl transferase domain-containing protein